MNNMKKGRKYVKNGAIASIPEETREKIIASDQNETAKRMTKRPQ